MSARLRVLVVAHGVPWPLNGGGRIRLYHFLAQLARWFEVTLAVPAADRPDADAPFGLCSAAEAGDNDGPRTGETPTLPAARALFPSPPGDLVDVVTIPTAPGSRPASSTPWILRRIRRHFGHDPGITEWLRANTGPERFDVVLLNGAVYGQYAGDCRCSPRRVVWNPTDELALATIRDRYFRGVPPADGEGARPPRPPGPGPLRTCAAWIHSLGRAFMYAWFERHVARRVATTILVSPVDAAWLRRWTWGGGERAAPRSRICTIANGVDLDYFQPQPEPHARNTIVFVGSLEFLPNIDGITHFARRVWPHLHQRDASRRLHIVGRRPVAEVRALASLPGIEVIADVPDVRPHYAAAAAVVAPLRKGGGLRNKVLEACAMGRPVVASPTALAGLQLRPGLDVCTAGDPSEWIYALEELWDRPAYAARIAANGLAYVRRMHRWDAVGAQLRDLLLEVARGSHADDGAAATGRTPMGSGAGAPAPPGAGGTRVREPSITRNSVFGTVAPGRGRCCPALKDKPPAATSAEEPACR